MRPEPPSARPQTLPAALAELDAALAKKPPEPPLTGAELVGVRQLLEERFGAEL